MTLVLLMFRISLKYMVAVLFTKAAMTPYEIIMSIAGIVTVTLTVIQIGRKR